MKLTLPTGHAQQCENERVFCCPHCEAPLGSTDGQRLIVGAIIITDSIKLTCVACREPYEWKPDPRA